MQYMLMFYETTDGFTQRQTAPEAYWGSWSAYVRAIQDAGITRGGAGLQPPDLATTVRVRDGHRQVQDGPFADTKEQLGGFFLIEVSSLDDALQWASRAPCAATGSVEVRPQLPPMQG